jgi:hypothetical protein
MKIQNGHAHAGLLLKTVETTKLSREAGMKIQIHLAMEDISVITGPFG